MGASGGLGRGTALGVVATGLDRVAALGIALWLPRHLGLDDYGRYTLVITLLAFCQTLPDASLESVLVARIARDWPEGARLAGAAVPLRATMSLAFGLAGLAAVGLASGDAGLAAAAAPWALGLWLAAASPYRALLRGQLRLGRYLGIVAAQAAATIVTLVIVVQAGQGLAGVLTTGAVGGAAGLATGRLLAGAGARPRIDRAVARTLARAATPLAATTLVVVGAQQIVQVLLLRSHGPDALGLLGGAGRLVDAVNLLPQAVVVGLLPALARSAGSPAALRTAREAARALALLLAPVAAGLAIWAAPVLATLLGAPFAAAGPVLRVLAAVALLAGSGQVLTALLVAEGRERVLLGATSASAALTVVLGTVLVPSQGAVGAAAAAALGMLGGQLGLVVLADTRAAALGVLRAMGRPLALGAGAAGLAVWSGFGVPFGPALLAVVYGAAVVATRTATWRDVRRWTRGTAEDAAGPPNKPAEPGG
jgi:O-antigen/teichoic acid export membrane protein